MREEGKREWRGGEKKGRKVKGGERVVRRTEEGSGSKGEWWGMRGKDEEENGRK